MAQRSCLGRSRICATPFCFAHPTRTGVIRPWASGVGRLCTRGLCQAEEGPAVPPCAGYLARDSGEGTVPLSPPDEGAVRGSCTLVHRALTLAEDPRAGLDTLASRRWRNLTLRHDLSHEFVQPFRRVRIETTKGGLLNCM